MPFTILHPFHGTEDVVFDMLAQEAQLAECCD